jgi:hypothetical protein
MEVLRGRKAGCGLAFSSLWVGRLRPAGWRRARPRVARPSQPPLHLLLPVLQVKGLGREVGVGFVGLGLDPLSRLEQVPVVPKAGRDLHLPAPCWAAGPRPSMSAWAPVARAGAPAARRALRMRKLGASSGGSVLSEPNPGPGRTCTCVSARRALVLPAAGAGPGARLRPSPPPHPALLTGPVPHHEGPVRHPCRPRPDVQVGLRAGEPALGKRRRLRSAPPSLACQPQALALVPVPKRPGASSPGPTP